MNFALSISLSNQNIQGNPKVKIFKTEPLKNYMVLQEILEGVVATGVHARSQDDAASEQSEGTERQDGEGSSMQRKRKIEEESSEEDEDINSGGHQAQHPISTSLSSCNSSNSSIGPGHGGSVGPKASRKKTGASLIADALYHMTEQDVIIKEKALAKRTKIEEAIELAQKTGLPEEDLVDAMDILMVEGVAMAFCCMSPGLRKAWLVKKIAKERGSQM